MSELPKEGTPWEQLDRELDEAKANDVDWKRGRAAVYIHYAGEDVLDVAKRAYLKYFSENGLGPKAFLSLAGFERDIIGWGIGLFHGGSEAKGALSSGGTESIFMAVKAARDQARSARRLDGLPQIVATETAHPAFDKAAHYLGLEVIRVPMGADFRADVPAMEKAITSRTIMLVGSAPAFPHGMIDPIPELGRLAQERGLWLHVDACVGGYIAPFAKKLGYAMPDFDFAVPGVTSISADLHKYGYTAKGASSVFFRDEESFRHLRYDFNGWPRGLYSTNTLVGTRPGGAIAAAWAVMRYLGEGGYLRTTERILATRRAYEAGVQELGLKVWGKPELGIFTYGSENRDIFAIADRLATRGWLVGRLVEPPGIHLMLNMTHEPVVGEYLADLKASIAEAAGARGKEVAATY